MLHAKCCAAHAVSPKKQAFSRSIRKQMIDTRMEYASTIRKVILMMPILIAGINIKPADRAIEPNRRRTKCFLCGNFLMKSICMIKISRKKDI